MTKKDYKNILKSLLNYRQTLEYNSLMFKSEKLTEEFFKKMSKRDRKKILKIGNFSDAFYMQYFYKYEKKPEKPKKVYMTYKEAKKLLNKIFLLNKNVKRKAYNTVVYDNCYFCGRTEKEIVENNLDWLCPNHDWRECCFVYTHVDYNLKNKEYNKKSMYLKTLINGILQNKIDEIKVWKKEGIIYFSLEGRQFSFHDPENEIKAPYKKWKWSKNKNKKPLIEG